MDGNEVKNILEYELGGPREASEGGPIAVLLHGRGSDERDLQGLSSLVPADWTLVTPRAPHPAGPWGYGPGWAWYQHVRENQVAPETIDASLRALDDFLDQLPSILDREPGPIILGGFSQGGTISLSYSLSRPGRVAAALDFSGFLEASADLSNASVAPPIFWGHGLMDPAVSHTLAISGRARLAEAGIEFTARDYAIGHWIVPEEIDEAAEMVRLAIG